MPLQKLAACARCGAVGIIIKLSGRVRIPNCGVSTPFLLRSFEQVTRDGLQIATSIEYSVECAKRDEEPAICVTGLYIICPTPVQRPS
ncbi:unnamed protein product, partial [Iphiclides podalirius]